MGLWCYLMVHLYVFLALGFKKNFFFNFYNVVLVSAMQQLNSNQK